MPRLVLCKHLHGNLAVFRVVHLHLAHAEQHQHDLGVDGHVLRQQHPTPREVGRLLHQLCVLSLERPPELLHHAADEQRLGDERVHSGIARLVGDVLPAIRREDDDGCLVPHRLANPSGCLDAIHVGHPPVHQNQVVGIAPCVANPRHLQALLARQRLVAPDAHLTQHHLRMVARNGIVVDHQHAQVVRQRELLLDSRICAVGILQRHHHRKGRALSLLALYLDGAIHELHDALGDGHSQSRAPKTARSRRILLAEGVKDLGQELLAHANARVLHHKAQGGAPHVAHGHLHREGDTTALRRKLDRIPQDVDEHLPELHVVADVVVAHVPLYAAFVV